jgi:chemotaxis protein MotB
MRRSWMILCVTSLFGLGAASGCQNKLHDENLELHRQNRELQSQLSDAQNRLRQAPDPNQVSSMQASMQQEIAQRDAKIADLQAQLQKPAPGAPADSGLGDIQVTRDDRAGTITVNLPGDVLFDSGKSDLKASAKTTLDKVVKAIKKDYSGKKIMVDGYTDTDPITRTKDKWEDNLDLSAARARTVAKYLASEGISTAHPRAFGDTSPRGSKPQSRRVEIVVATR